MSHLQRRRRPRTTRSTCPATVEVGSAIVMRIVSCDGWTTPGRTAASCVVWNLPLLPSTRKALRTDCPCLNLLALVYNTSTRRSSLWC